MADKIDRYYYEEDYKNGKCYKVYERGVIKYIALLWNKKLAKDLVDALNSGLMILEE